MWIRTCGDALYSAGVARIVCELDALGVLDLLLCDTFFVAQDNWSIGTGSAKWRFEIAFIAGKRAWARIIATPTYRPSGPAWLADVTATGGKHRGAIGFTDAVSYVLHNIEWTLEPPYYYYDHRSYSIENMTSLLNKEHGWIRQYLTPVALSILSQSPA